MAFLQSKCFPMFADSWGTCDVLLHHEELVTYYYITLEQQLPVLIFSFPLFPETVAVRNSASTILILNISNSTLIDCVIGSDNYPCAVAEARPLMREPQPQMQGGSQPNLFYYYLIYLSWRRTFRGSSCPALLSYILHFYTSHPWEAKTTCLCVFNEGRCRCSCGQQGAAQSSTPPPSPSTLPSAGSLSINIHSSRLNCVIIGDKNYMQAEQTHLTETEEPWVWRFGPTERKHWKPSSTDSIFWLGCAVSAVGTKKWVPTLWSPWYADWQEGQLCVQLVHFILCDM